MVRNDASILKQQRIKEIKTQMAKHIAKGITPETILDWIEINIGLTRKTARGYVDLICRVNGWAYIDGKIKAALS